MFLRTMDSGSEVIIRTVSSFDKTLDTRPLMKDRFQVGERGERVRGERVRV